VPRAAYRIAGRRDLTVKAEINHITSTNRSDLQDIRYPVVVLKSIAPRTAHLLKQQSTSTRSVAVTDTYFLPAYDRSASFNSRLAPQSRANTRATSKDSADPLFKDEHFAPSDYLSR